MSNDTALNTVHKKSDTVKENLKEMLKVESLSDTKVTSETSGFFLIISSLQSFYTRHFFLKQYLMYWSHLITINDFQKHNID